MLTQEHKFQEGDVVFEITRPQQLMLVTKRNGLVYYCLPIHVKGHQLIFMERDLKVKPSDS